MDPTLDRTPEAGGCYVRLSDLEELVLRGTIKHRKGEEIGPVENQEGYLNMLLSMDEIMVNPIFSLYYYSPNLRMFFWDEWNITVFSAGAVLLLLNFLWGKKRKKQRGIPSASSFQETIKPSENEVPIQKQEPNSE